MDSINNYAEVNNNSDSEDENERIRNFDVDVLRDIGLRFEEEINEDLNDFSEANILESQFKTEDQAYIFYNAYAKLKGFSVRKDMLKVKNGVPIRRRFVCSFAGKRREKLFNLSNQKKNPRRVTRCDCLAMLSIVYCQTINMWIVRKFVTNHTHNLAPRDSSQFLRSHRKVDVNDAVLSNNLYTVGMSKKLVMELLVARAGGHALAGCTMRDLYNHMNRERVKRCTDGDANAVNAYMDNRFYDDPGFFKKHQTNDENQLTKIFWADSKSQEDYKRFNDVLLFDATYRTNRYAMPVIIFAGINNYRHTVVFGIAVMSDECTSSYVWALESFLAAMDGVEPKSVITDGDNAIRNAIEQVLPFSKHRLCSWHILQNALTNVHVVGFHKDFCQVMLARGPPENFEKKWDDLLKKYKKVKENKWVKKIYDRKKMWAEAYMMENFFAGCISNQRCESMNSVIRRSVKSGLTLIELVEKLDSKLAYIRHRTHEAEVSTVMTKSARVVNLTALGKHAESIYTQGAYEFFYKQLLNEPAYVVNDIDDDGGYIVRYQVNRHMYPHRSSIVEYNNKKVSYNCSCKLFERSGFLCRHILGVLKHTHVNELPKSSILPRWTQDVRLSTSDVGQDSFRKQIGVSLRLKDLECNTHEVFKWASQSIERFQKLKAYIEEFEKSEIEKNPTSLGFEQILPDIPPGFEHPQVSTPEFVPQPDNVRDPPRTKGKGRPKARKRKIWERTTIRCGLCGMEGHSRDMCRDRVSDDATEVIADVNVDLSKRSSSSLRKYTCSFCKVVGHRINACPEKHNRSVGAKVIKKRKRKTKSNELRGGVDMGDAYLHKDANGNSYWKLKDL